MVGKVEVEGVTAVGFGFEVEVPPGAVGLVPAGGVEERHEQRIGVATVKDVGG